jgi:hypothetical protein
MATPQMEMHRKAIAAISANHGTTTTPVSVRTSVIKRNDVHAPKTPTEDSVVPSTENRHEEVKSVCTEAFEFD